ncbi:TlpA family protein disulfide reductase [Salibacterium salarium]|uniref:TlpA family protein disulfide reductase n=1 Tax=Salibacterium salarium TaxID=284579 RepID=A0A3R9P7J0_9BACI|nr:redoxin domain-containing protein [Salibacterium salarium]RSL32023.1 TlpA family protein disulfide reductase [Salibacterium salarium]
MLNHKYVTILVLATAAAAIAYVLFANISVQKVGTDIGDTAPNYELPMYNGQTASLTDYEGDIIVMNMWASWCEPCKEEVPALLDFHNSYKEQGVTVLTVNMDLKGSKKAAEEFVEDYNMTTTPAMKNGEGKVDDLYNITHLPTTYIISRDRTIVEKVAGPLSFEQLEDIVEKEL